MIPSSTHTHTPCPIAIACWTPINSVGSWLKYTLAFDNGRNNHAWTIFHGLTWIPGHSRHDDLTCLIYSQPKGCCWPDSQGQAGKCKSIIKQAEKRVEMMCFLTTVANGSSHSLLIWGSVYSFALISALMIASPTHMQRPFFFGPSDLIPLSTWDQVGSSWRSIPLNLDSI